MKTSWKCQNCDELCDRKYEICWNCGSHQDGSPADPDFVRFDAKLPELVYVRPSNYRIGRFLAVCVEVVGWLLLIVGMGVVVLSALKGFKPEPLGESIKLVISGAMTVLFAKLCDAVFDIADGRSPGR